MINRNRTSPVGVPGVALLTALLVSMSLAAGARAATVDPAFGEGGTVITESGFPLVGELQTKNFTGNVWQLLEDPQGRLLVGGSAGNNMYVARYLENGQLDPSFADQGRAIIPNTPKGPGDDRAITYTRGLEILPDGKIMVVGKEVQIDWPQLGDQWLYSYPRYLRLTADGQIDEDFGRIANNEREPGFPESPEFYPKDSALGSDGTLYIAGQGLTDGNSAFPHSMRYGLLLAIKPEGGRDKRFGDNGKVKLFPMKSKYWTEFSTIKRLGSGKLLVSGYHRDQAFLGRILQSGRWDKSFGPEDNGRMILRTRLPDGSLCHCTWGRGIDRDSKGRIYQTGFGAPSRTLSTQRYLKVWRYLPNGRLDRSYGNRGRVSLDVGPVVRPYRLAVKPSGRAFVTAALGPNSYASTFKVFAFRPNGARDTSFFEGGTYTDAIGPDSISFSAIIDSKGRLVVGGGTNLNDDSTMIIKRFIVD